VELGVLADVLAPEHKGVDPLVANPAGFTILSQHPPLPRALHVLLVTYPPLKNQSLLFEAANAI